MGVASFTTFFAASAGAGATLVGLLFVAVSIAPERVFGKQAAVKHQLVASSAFTALINAFFISLGALIPSTSSLATATVVLIMGGIAFVNSLAFSTNLMRHPTMEMTLRSIGLLLIGLVLYGYEVWNALLLIRTPGNLNPLYSICGVLVGVYGYGIVRAWQLLGADRRGIVSFIIPLLHKAQQAHADAAKTDGESTRMGEARAAALGPHDADRQE